MFWWISVLWTLCKETLFPYNMTTILFCFSFSFSFVRWNSHLSIIHTPTLMQYISASRSSMGLKMNSLLYMVNLLVVDPPSISHHVYQTWEVSFYIVRSCLVWGYCIRSKGHFGLIFTRYADTISYFYIILNTRRLTYILYFSFFGWFQNIDKIGMVSCPVLVIHVSWHVLNLL